MAHFSLSQEEAKWDEPARARLSELREYCTARGVEVRDDSRLALRFAQGKLPAHVRTVDEVCQELYCTNEIYKHTDYGATVQSEMREVASQLVQTGLSWNDAWNLTRTFAPELLKYRCMRLSNHVHQSPVTEPRASTSWADACP